MSPLPKEPTTPQGKALRKARGKLSKAQAAQRLGVGENTYDRWERQGKPTLQSWVLRAAVERLRGP